jgi:hypothetical protein
VYICISSHVSYDLLDDLALAADILLYIYVLQECLQLIHFALLLIYEVAHRCVGASADCEVSHGTRHAQLYALCSMQEDEGCRRGGAEGLLDVGRWM